MSLHATVWGDPNRPAFVFLHGFLGSHADWMEVIEKLSDSYYCLAYDLPGHGRSLEVATESYTVPGAARLIAEDLPRRSLVQPTIIGYSMGGRIALYLALHHPEIAMGFVIESSSPGLLDPETAVARLHQDQQWAERWRTEPIDTVLQDWYRQPVFAGLAEQGAVYDRMLARRRQNRGEHLARSMAGMSVGAQVPLWDALNALSRALLVLAGERDHKYRRVAKEMAARSARVETAVIARAGHNAHLEAPDAFVRALRQFAERDIKEQS